MATQREVADAFFEREDTPSSASNFEIVHHPEKPVAALVGGSDFVYAQREPLNSFTVYDHRPMFRSQLRNESHEEDSRFSLRDTRAYLDQLRTVQDSAAEYQTDRNVNVEAVPDSPSRTDRHARGWVAEVINVD